MYLLNCEIIHLYLFYKILKVVIHIDKEIWVIWYAFSPERSEK